MLFNNKDSIEIVHNINSIDMEREIISRIHTDLKTNHIFYTDKTGYE